MSTAPVVILFVCLFLVICAFFVWQIRKRYATKEATLAESPTTGVLQTAEIWTWVTSSNRYDVIRDVERRLFFSRLLENKIYFSPIVGSAQFFTASTNGQIAATEATKLGYRKCQYRGLLSPAVARALWQLR
jgi:hypothetical protein